MTAHLMKNFKCLYTSKGLPFMDNGNIDKSYMNRSNIQLNRRSQKLLISCENQAHLLKFPSTLMNIQQIP